jgi:hypothetical protein
MLANTLLLTVMIAILVLLIVVPLDSALTLETLAMIKMLVPLTLATAALENALIFL